MRRKLIRLVSTLALVACSAGGALAAGMPEHLPLDDLIIETRSGDLHPFRIRIASAPEDRRKGLMFVDTLADDEGMLFDNGQTGLAGMWMKNTPLSLDMLFIRADGTISSIVAQTTPFSRRSIYSSEPVLAVLEIRGGVAGRLGIAPGDRVVHRLFQRPDG